MSPPKGRRASCVGGDQQGICTVVLLSLSKKPMMNLHKVPLQATILMIKEKISERLKDVGRALPADSILLYEGESRDPEKELDDAKELCFYNFLGLSRFSCTIVRRTRVDLIICLVKREKRCLCLTTQKPQREEFTVNVPFAFTAAQLEHYIAECLNCGVSRTDIALHYDQNLQEGVPREATLRQMALKNNTTLYALMPPAFTHEKLKIIELPVKKIEPSPSAAAAAAAAATDTSAAAEGAAGAAAADAAAAGGGGAAAAAANAAAAGGAAAAGAAGAVAAVIAAAAAAEAAPEDLAITDAVEVTGPVKTPQQIAFEKQADKKGSRMSRNKAGDYARTLGYAPSKKEIEALPADIDFKAFQAFLNIAMHPEDSDGAAMKDFFSSFDTQVTGDLTRKQVENVLQMWGDEPLTPQEADEFCNMLFSSGETTVPIKALVAFIQEGTA